MWAWKGSLKASPDHLTYSTREFRGGGAGDGGWHLNGIAGHTVESFVPPSPGKTTTAPSSEIPALFVVEAPLMGVRPAELVFRAQGYCALTPDCVSLVYPDRIPVKVIPRE